MNGAAVEQRCSHVAVLGVRYRGASLIRNCHPLGHYSRPLPRALRWSQEGCRPATDPAGRVVDALFGDCRGASIIRNCLSLGHSRPMPEPLRTQGSEAFRWRFKCFNF